jgi:hypothetical protein
MQSFKAGPYRGERVMLSASVKHRDVSDWAGIWMRIDGAHDELLGFDNMRDRPLRGTNNAWTPVHIVLDVPRQAEVIALGILMSGRGEAWLDDVTLTIVEISVPLTGGAAETSAAAVPQNLDFER